MLQNEADPALDPALFLDPLGDLSVPSACLRGAWSWKTCDEEIWPRGAGRMYKGSDPDAQNGKARLKGIRQKEASCDR
jgi:hypothetical protein